MMIDELINRIEDTVYSLMKYDMELYSQKAQELAEEMISVFPSIISCYSGERMWDHAEDAKYWPGQLERVLNVLQTGDDWATADILFNETRANLVELKGILEERDII